MLKIGDTGDVKADIMLKNLSFIEKLFSKK